MGADTTFFKKLTQNAKNVANFIKKNEEEAMQQALEHVYKDINEIFEEGISEFYDEYTPRYYHRKYALYDTYRITKTKNSLIIQADGSYMPSGIHRASNDYIFDLVFVQGYHGGAFSDETGGDEPYWRVPPLTASLPPGIKPYTDWGSVAEQTESPDSKIYTKLIAYDLSKIAQKYVVQSYFNIVKQYF